MKSCRVFVPYGSIGQGIPQETFDIGISRKPDVIATDAGSTDSGPYYLGTGSVKYADGAVRNDLRQCVVGANKLGIPLLIGSCYTCGVDSGVDAVEKMILEICKEEGIHGKKIAKIYTEQSPEVLKKKYREGKIISLNNAPEINEDTFSECSHIVALGGVEPFLKALEEGADIVLSGRCTDTAVLAAMPMYMGCNVAAAWHGAKICECGPCCTSKQTDNGVILTVDEEGFTVETLDPTTICTPYTCSAHMLYENADPFVMTEPSHILDVSEAVYTQLPDGRVRVTGAKYTKKPYTMKLEGAGPTGYQTISMVGIMNKDVLYDPMVWVNGVSDYMKDKLKRQNYPLDDFDFNLKVYGWNAITGVDVKPGSCDIREILVLLTVTAKTQELAHEVAKAFNFQLLHYTLDAKKEGALLRTYAFPFSPNEIDKGVLYEFKLNHAVEVDSPMELVRYTTTMVQ